MSQKREDILDSCIELARSGGDPEHVLQEHPEHADEIRALLGVASDLAALPSPRPNTERMMGTLARALAQAPAQPHRGKPRKAFFLSLEFWVRSAAAILVVLSVSWGTGTLASSAVPGELLYPIKTLIEDMRYSLAATPEGKAELSITFSEERLAEFLKKYHRGEGSDRQLLQRMLGHAKQALEAGESMPELERLALVERLACVCRYQMESLREVSEGMEDEDRRLLAPYIEACGERCECLHEMRGCGEGCGLARPNSEAIRHGLSKFSLMPEEPARQGRE